MNDQFPNPNIHSNPKAQMTKYHLGIRPWSLIGLWALVIGIWLLPHSVQAATLYWVGGNGDNVGTNANDWSNTNL
jgi:hypothetical protein